MGKKQKEIIKLEKDIQKPSFCQDQEKAKKITQKLSNLKEQVGLWEEMEKEVQELIDLGKLVEKEPEKGLEKEIEKRYKTLNKKFAEHELEVLLSEKYDEANAILSIHAGTGGVDAQDWSSMLLRMYLRFAEAKKWKSNILDKSLGAEAGIKSVTLEIRGSYAYGYLKREAGVHRLVRLSPFNSANLRETSFALVEVLPEIENVKEVEMKQEDLRIDTFRSGGKGGQNVNKVETAVRVTHIPSGLVAACSQERSQVQNKQKALQVLASKLIQKNLEEKELTQAKLRVSQESAKWGAQIRSYVLHPYKLVKDHRTGVEVKDVEKILNGKLEPFIEAELRKKF